MRLIVFFIMFSTTLHAQQLSDQQLFDHIKSGMATSSLPITKGNVEIMSAPYSLLSKIRHVYFIQLENGIPIRGTESSIHLSNNNDILKLHNRFTVAAATSKSPTLSANQALQAVCQQLNYSQITTFKQINDPSTTNLKQKFSNPTISKSDIPVQLAYFLDHNKELVLAWDLSIEEVSGKNWWSLLVDANSGVILEQNNWMVHCQFDKCQSSNLIHHHHNIQETNNWLVPQQTHNKGNTGNYRVFELPKANPNDGPRSLVSFQSSLGSPYGWHDTSGVASPDFTITRGNNAFSYYHNNSTSTTVIPDGGQTLNFDFPLDLTLPADQNIEAGVTQLFYSTNKIHDILFANGFDEASGNFQAKNYTGLGEDDDPVRTVSQFSNLCNASFASPPDGISGVMHNNVCNGRDGALSTIVVAHEYAHGLSYRLTGGSTSSNCLNNQEQMGEGWSDFLGILLTIEQGDIGTAPSPIAPWLFNSSYGIRAYPYSTDMTINPLTYDRIKTMGAPYGVGLNWCTMLWEMTWGLIDHHGWDADLYNGTGGNNIALKLVIEGMKLQPCRPGFVDGRDAILAADMAIYGGVNQCIIWEAFAKRGLGACADQGLSTDKTDGFQGFNLPPSCGGSDCGISIQGISEVTIPWQSGLNSFQFTVFSNATWYATTDVPWITINTATGTGSATITYNYTTNNALTERIGNIFITCDSLCIYPYNIVQGVQPCNQFFSTLPYTTEFENTSLDQFWCTASSETTGNIQITSQHNPIQQGHLTMDAEGTINNLNVASLGLNFQGRQDIHITFNWKEFNDESDPEDGVYFSDNGGANFTKVFSLTNGISTYQFVDLSIDQLASIYGLSLSNTFVIRFQQYGKDSIPNDGIAIDDILVYSNICPPYIPCDDNDPCTINDTYNSSCICTGILLDSDEDDVCDLYDICPGGDDNIDYDNDGIPDFCDSSSLCNDCTTLINVFPHVENFEPTNNSEVCQYPGDDFDWSFYSGPTPSYGTGPNAAYEGIWYFYTEVTSSDVPFKSAVFQSGCYDLSTTGTAQLDFWYHMRNYQIGSLELQFSIDTGRTWLSAWLISGNQGNQWHHQVIDVSPYTGNLFSYRFLGKTKTNVKSDIALDLITLDYLGCIPGNGCDDNDPCTINDILDASCNCIGTFQDMDNDGVCDVNDSCPGGDDHQDIDHDGIPDFCDASNSCNDCSHLITNFPHTEDFEPNTKEICQYDGDDFDWSIRSGSTHTNHTGPTAAFQGINYFYTEASIPNHPDKVAAFQSGCYDLPLSATTNLNFWYHMYGADMGKMDLEITIDTGKTWTTLWTRSGDQGDSWQYESIDITAYSGNRFSYRFIATTSSGPTSDFALDSITIDLPCLGVVCDDNDPCTINDVSDALCNCAGTFQDTDNDGVCDVNDSCPGGDDHQDIDNDGIADFCDVSSTCNDCSHLITNFPHTEGFEPNLKEICQYDGDDFDWSIRSGSTHTNHTGPTAAYQGANYLYTEASTPNHPDKVAAFQSGCYDLTGPGIANLDFWYHMYGSTMGTIQLEISIDTGKTWVPVWTKSGDQTDQWHYQFLDLTPYVDNILTYRVLATTTTGPTSDFALDSITLDFAPTCNPGTTCNDSDSCTINDILDAECNCAGTFQDTDLDTVCDAQDVCPGHDDTIDDDGDGVPNGCDSVMTAVIDNIDQVISLNAYPNPFSHEIDVELNGLNGSLTQGFIEVTDVIGRTIFSQQIEWANSFEIRLPLGDIANGVYYIQYKDEQYQAVQKILKMR